ncbi:MAG: hypothetical protein R3A52_23705 [Polyangiales bacterium]
MSALSLDVEVSPVTLIGRFFHVLRQMVVDARMTRDERLLADHLQLGVETYGRALAAATDDEALNEAIDDLLADHGFAAYTRTLTDLFLGSRASDIAVIDSHVEAIPGVPDDVMNTLGRCMSLTSTLARALRPLLNEHREELQRSLRRVDRRSVLEVVYDSPQHPIEMDHGLAFYRASLCQLGFAAAVLGGPSSAVRLRRLADRIERELLKGLTLMASTPGFDVPTDVIPLEQRLPLQALRDEANLVRVGDHVLAALVVPSELLPEDDES